MEKNLIRGVGTPVCDLIRDYQARNMLRLHMPGHKGHGLPEALDITEIKGLGPLYPAEGVILESEEAAAALFGAGRTVFSAEGSSLCIRAMLMLIKMRAEEEGSRPLVLAGRNAHASFFSAAALLGMEVAWLRGENLLTCRLTEDELRNALENFHPAAVYLTSPDYLGNQADIRTLAEVCHSKEIPLLVDNAHGAYLRFLPEDQHPLSLGADITCDSAHKTLPVLTGGAYLHIHQDTLPLFVQQAERAMAMFASTSPSWLILQSLDHCNSLLAGPYRERLAAFAKQVSELKDRLRNMGFEQVGEEALKITLQPKSYGYTGNELHDLLRKSGIECEFSDPDFLVMMVTPETGEDGLARLETALADIPRRKPLRTLPPPLPEPAPAMSLSTAMLALAESVPTAKSLGRILADPCVNCPPAIPILVSGERISQAAIRCFEYYGISHVLCVNPGDQSL